MSATPAPLIRRDTRAWRAQVWLSFLMAVLLCVGGLLWLPGADIDRAFMVMGYVFSLCSALVLAKTVRDQETRRSAGDTPLWNLVVWGGFALAMALTAWGLLRMDIQPVWKAYLIVAWLYLISSAFTLAKTLRDGYEVSLLEARLAGRREASEARIDSRIDARLDGLQG
jgi:hypothetical protein